MWARPNPPNQTDDAKPFAVTCRGLTKDFRSGQGRIQVLHGIDLDVRFGEQLFIVGPSGCGKTTLVSIIAGLLKATDGELQVLGADLRKMRGGKLVDFRARYLGFIFQQFNLLPSLTALENAAVPLIVQGCRHSKALQEAGKLLDRLEMSPHRHKYPNQLSGGQQQRVAIARSLVHQPRLLICDEPTASLDAQTGLSVMQMLRELSVANDRAVIVVTHDNRVFSFADRIAHISDGIIQDIELVSNSN